MEFKIAFTDKEVTPWGGMSLLKNMLEQISFKNVVQQCPYLPQPGSNRGYAPLQIIESFIVSIWCGANRFLHTEVTRHDQALGDIFDWKQVPGNDTYKRFFSKFTQAVNQNVFDHFYRWFFPQLHFDHFTIDFDSSVLTRYGQQQGAVKGYNPKKSGRASHHPLMAFVADCQMVANFWLRSGDAHASNNFVSFPEDTLKQTRKQDVGLVRLDSGFTKKKYLSIWNNIPPAYPILLRRVCMLPCNGSFPNKRPG